MDESILQSGARGVENSERLMPQALEVVLVDLRVRR